MKSLLKIAFIALCVSPMSLLAADASKLESLTVMALGSVDGRAVLKMGDGKMQVLKLGDTIPGTKAVVTQVLIDKLVVEETIDKEGGASMTQTVWIFKPKKAGEKSTVQRLDREGPTPALTQKPVKVEVREGK
jgi:hypothetical protein